MAEVFPVPFSWLCACSLPILAYGVVWERSETFLADVTAVFRQWGTPVVTPVRVPHRAANQIYEEAEVDGSRGKGQDRDGGPH